MSTELLTNLNKNGKVFVNRCKEVAVLQIIDGGRGVSLSAENEALRAAIARISTGQQHLAILDEGEAEALYRTLRNRDFTATQLEEWTARLLADHPYERTKTIGVRPGLLAWLTYIFLAGRKPQAFLTIESVLAWRKRAKRYVEEEIASVAAPQWLERYLSALEESRDEVVRETGKAQWATPVMRWALIQLLTITGDLRSAHATG